jgi:hypothetical protein
VAVYVAHFSCTSEESARRLANAIMVAGLEPELTAPRLPHQPWWVAAPAALEATAANLAQLQEAMTEAAVRSGARLHSLQPER